MSAAGVSEGNDKGKVGHLQAQLQSSVSPIYECHDERLDQDPQTAVGYSIPKQHPLCGFKRQEGSLIASERLN